jgi:hypothetical protein
MYDAALYKHLGKNCFINERTWESPTFDCSPNNVYVPSEYLDNMSIYFSPCGGSFSNTDLECFRSYIRLYLHELLNIDGTKFISPYSLTQVIDRARIELGDKSAGYPYGCSKKHAIDKLPHLVNDRIGKFRNGKYDNSDGPFIMAFLRTQKFGKMRLVLGVPLEANIVEGLYLRPIADRISAVNRAKK